MRWLGFGHLSIIFSSRRLWELHPSWQAVCSPVFQSSAHGFTNTLFFFLLKIQSNELKEIIWFGFWSEIPLSDSSAHEIMHIKTVTTAAPTTFFESLLCLERFTECLMCIISFSCSWQPNVVGPCLASLICVCVLSHSVVSDSLWPHGLKPVRLLHPWDSPGKNTGVCCLALLQGSSWPRDQTHICCIDRWILYHWATCFSVMDEETGSEGFYKFPKVICIVKGIGI